MGLFADCGCGCDGKKQEKKLLISLMAALTFFIIASPETFRIMRRLLGKWVSSPTGCPTSSGLILHTIVFMLVTWGLMNIKNEGYETESMDNDSELVDQELQEELIKNALNKGMSTSDGNSPSSGSGEYESKVKQAEMKMQDAHIEMEKIRSDMEQEDPTEETASKYATKIEQAGSKMQEAQMEMQKIHSEVENGMELPSLPISTTQKNNGDPSRPGLVPTRMADANLPLPGISEEPIGLYDSGMVFGSVDIYEDMDSPSFINDSSMKGNTLNVSCRDGSRPITI